MDLDEALEYAIDNKITFRFHREDGVIKLIAYQLPFRAVVVDKLTWTFKRVFKGAILPAINKLKTQSQT